MELPEGFALACVMEREDPVTPSFHRATPALEALPQVRWWASSLRRQVLLQALRPDLKIEPLRGNLDNPFAQARRRPVRRDCSGRRGTQTAEDGRAHPRHIRPTAMLPAAGQGPWALVRSDRKT